MRFTTLGRAVWLAIGPAGFMPGCSPARTTKRGPLPQSIRRHRWREDRHRQLYEPDDTARRFGTINSGFHSTARPFVVIHDAICRKGW